MPVTLDKSEKSFTKQSDISEKPAPVPVRQENYKATAHHVEEIKIAQVEVPKVNFAAMPSASLKTQLEAMSETQLRQLACQFYKYENKQIAEELNEITEERVKF